MEALREQRTEVAECYGSLKSSSATDWSHIKQGFFNAYGALQQAWEKAEREFAADDNRQSWADRILTRQAT